MSYIELPSGAPDTKKLVLSLWFRIPGTTMDNAIAAGEAPSGDPMAGVIPLVMFGPPTKIDQYENNTTFGGTGQITTNYFVGIDPLGGGRTFTVIDGYPVTAPGSTQEYVKTGTVDGRPSYIGVVCGGLRPVLDVNIVMPKDNLATMDGGTNYAISATGSSDDNGLYLGNIQDCVLITDGPLPPTYTIAGESDRSGAQLVLGGVPEVFRTCFPGGPAGSPDDYTGPTIIPNHWHHLLFCLDVTSDISLKGGMSSRVSVLGCQPIGGTCIGGTATTSVAGGQIARACKMYIALDDKNLTDRNLTAYRDKSSGHNDIITDNGYKMYKDEGTNISDTGCVRFGRLDTNTLVIKRPEYSYSPSEIPLSRGAISLPAQQDHFSSIYHVEMAEFQLFTDVSIDTGDILNRRAFITDKGTPAQMGKASGLLGKDPEIKLHGSGKWKKAKNTGTFESDTTGTHTGKIDTYRPNPNLNGNQGDAQ